MQPQQALQQMALERPTMCGTGSPRQLEFQVSLSLYLAPDNMYRLVQLTWKHFHLAHVHREPLVEQPSVLRQLRAPQEPA